MGLSPLDHLKIKMLDIQTTLEFNKIIREKEVTKVNATSPLEHAEEETVAQSSTGHKSHKSELVKGFEKLLEEDEI